MRHFPLASVNHGQVPEAGPKTVLVLWQFSRPRPFQLIEKHITSEMSLGTMVINALVINGSDPGAVPGSSTKSPSFGDRWG